jgi:hypothetical protein
MLLTEHDAQTSVPANGVTTLNKLSYGNVF